MALPALVLASFLTAPRENEHSGVLEDPWKASFEADSAENNYDHDTERQSRNIWPNGDATDDPEFIRDSVPQGANANEEGPNMPFPPGLRVAFTSTSSRGSSPSPEEAPVKRGLFAGLKSIIFPSQDENRPPSNYRILPVIVGLVIPFSILLEISGLTDKWYIPTGRSDDGETQNTPVGLDAMLAISMFFAVAANVSLICRFLEKGPVLATTLVTVASLTIHDSVNIVALLTFRVQRGLDDSSAYGHGYWMIVCSTSVSTATNFSLIWDLVWTRNFRKRGSGVSRKQRSLLIIVMLLLVYIAFGALVNSSLIKLDFIDGLYFTVVAIETIGFGDIVPGDTSSRVFICFYIVFGILSLGVAITVTRETIFEQVQISYQRRTAKILQRYQEHRNWRVWERKWKRAVEWRLREINAEIWMPDSRDNSQSMRNTPSEGEQKWTRRLFNRIASRVGFRERHNYFRRESEVRGITYGYPGTHLNVETLSRAQLEAAGVESGVPLCVLRTLRRRRAYLSRMHTITSQSSASTTRYWKRWFWSEDEPLPTERPTTQFMRGLEGMSGMLTKLAIATTGVGMDRTPSSKDLTTQRIRRQRSVAFDSSVSEITALPNGSLFTVHDDLEEITKREAKRAFWAKLVVSSTLFVVFWLTGAALFVATEKWSFAIAVYFCIITFTATGFGEFSPKTAAGRSVFVFWALLGLAVMTTLVLVLQDTFSSRYKNALGGGAFEDALKKYRQETKTHWEKKVQQESNEELRIPSRIRTSVVGQSSARAQQNLESLPEKVLEQAKHIHRYLAQGGRGGVSSTDLRLMLDDISQSQKLDEKTKEEILNDEDAKNMLCTLKFEKAIRELIDAAENARSALAERDIITGRFEEQRREDPGDHTTTSGTRRIEASHDSASS